MMRIGLIGGVERGEERYRAAAARAGHDFEAHSGHVGGRGGTALASLVERVDLLIITTDVNSHGAVLGARRLARERGVPTLIVRRCGLARFTGLLTALPDAPAKLEPTTRSHGHGV